jgi:filamentous hemagglutinin
MSMYPEATGHAYVGSGHDSTFRGVVLTAGAADLDVKGNFTLESVQDTSHGSGSSASFSGSGTFGTTGFNGSVSGGGSTSRSDRAWVTEQTGIYTTKGDLNANVGHNTTLIGSVMEAQGGQVHLDTQTLTMQDLQDHDVGTSYGGQVGFGYGEQQTGLGRKGQGSATLSGQVATHDIEQTTKAAIGQGTLTVRDEAHSQTTAAEANRDTANTQVITKNERAGVQAYVSSTAIKALVAEYKDVRNQFDRRSTEDFSEQKGIPSSVKEAVATGAFGILDLAQAIQLLLNDPEGLGADLTGKLRDAAATCSANSVCRDTAAEILANFKAQLASNPDLAQYTQQGGIKKLGDKPLLAVAQANGYATIHALKDAYGLDRTVNIAADRAGNLYAVGVKDRIVTPLYITATGR